jgi:O-antigen/teichoic acid export membrane protein
VCVGAAGALAASLWGYVGACLQAARSYAAFTAVQVVNAAARLVLMGGLLLAGWLTPALAVAAALGGYGAGAALGYALIRPAQRRARRCEALQPRLIEAARWLVASSVIYLLYVRLDQMLLSALRGPEAAGVYGAAVAFIQLLDLLTGSLLAVYLPRFAEAIDSASLRRRAWESVRVAALLALPIGPALYLACPLIDAVLGPRYAATTGLMMVILPGAILNALTHALQSVLIVRGRARRLTVLDAAMLGANGIGNVLAIGRWGMTGAAAVALATRLAASAWLAALVVHELRRGSAGPTSPAAQRPR